MLIIVFLMHQHRHNIIFNLPLNHWIELNTLIKLGMIASIAPKTTNILIIFHQISNLNRRLLKTLGPLLVHLWNK